MADAQAVPATDNCDSLKLRGINIREGSAGEELRIDKIFAYAVGHGSRGYVGKVKETRR